jgi:putative membrane protein
MHPGPWDGGPPPFLPFLGGFMFLLFLLLATGLFLLIRRGTFGAAPSWLAGRPAPEAEAKKTLADRFARGDISADEFMERASVLNWTPGSEQWPTPRKRRQ